MPQNYQMVMAGNQTIQTGDEMNNDIESFMSQHDVNQPEVTPGPAPITPLESALAKLENGSSKMVHLEPREASALFERVNFSSEIIRMMERTWKKNH